MFKHSCRNLSFEQHNSNQKCQKLVVKAQLQHWKKSRNSLTDLSSRELRTILESSTFLLPFRFLGCPVCKKKQKHSTSCSVHSKPTGVPAFLAMVRRGWATLKKSPQIIQLLFLRFFTSYKLMLLYITQHKQCTLPSIYANIGIGFLIFEMESVIYFCYLIAC